MSTPVIKASELLEILQDLPKGHLCKNLGNIPPGYIYLGPMRKQEKKIAPGVYAKPEFLVDDEEYRKDRNWFYLGKLIPYYYHQYAVLGFLPINAATVVGSCRNILEGVNLGVREIFWNSEVGQYSVCARLDCQTELIVGSGVNELEAAYRFYAEVCRLQYFMDLPALTHMEGVEELNLSWEGQETLVFRKYPEKLIEKYKSYFEEKRVGNCVGRFKLIEGDFWVLCLDLPPPTSYNGVKTKSGVSLGGVIKRLI